MKISRRIGIGLVAAILLPLGAAAQPLRFAVLADTHIGAGPEASAGLASLVEAINADPSIRFVVIDGDVTDKGRDADLDEAKAILGRLKAPCRVLPGNHDTHWGGFGGYGFVQAFGDNRFAFEADGTWFLGLSTWEQGHFAPDEIAWLEERVRGLPKEAEVFFFAHQPPETIDNWARVHNALRTRRTIVIAGHMHIDRQSVFHGLPVWTVRAAVPGRDRPASLAVVSLDRDKAEIGRPDAEGTPRAWGEFPRRGRAEAEALPVPPTLPAGEGILWRADLERRLVSAPVWDGQRLYAADLGGRLTCWNHRGKMLWTYQAQAPFISRPAVQGKFLLAASADGRVFKLNAATGGLYASADLGCRPISPIVPFEARQGKIPRFWVGTSDGRLLCLNSFNLTVFWTSRAAQGQLQAAPGGQASGGGRFARRIVQPGQALGLGEICARRSHGELLGHRRVVAQHFEEARAALQGAHQRGQRPDDQQPFAALLVALGRVGQGAHHQFRPQAAGIAQGHGQGSADSGRAHAPSSPASRAKATAASGGRVSVRNAPSPCSWAC